MIFKLCCLMMCLWVVGCESGPSNDLQKRAEELGLDVFLREEMVLLAVVEIEAGAEHTQSFKTDGKAVGVLLHDGYFLTKESKGKYSVALKVRNAVKPEENFGTSHGASGSMSADEKGMVKLLFKNNAKKRITFLVYVLNE